MRSLLLSSGRLAIFFTLLACCLFLQPSASHGSGAKPQQDNATAAPAATETGTAQSQLTRVLSTGNSRVTFLLRFSRPMVDVQKITPDMALAPEQLPIVFEPPIAGEGKWISATDLQFISYDPLNKATTFKIKARPGARALNGAEYRANHAVTPWLFEWYNVSQRRYAKDGTVTLRLSFSTLVEQAKVKQALTVRTKDGKTLPFEVRAEGDDTKTKSQYLEVLVKVPNFDPLTLSLPKGFAGEEGPQGLSEAQERKVVPTSMLVIRTVRARQSDSPPWDRYISVDTTNDVDMDTLRQYLEVTPETDVKIRARSGGFDITGDFITRPRVTLTFKKGLPGILGYLTEDFKSTVVFNDFSPRLALDTQGSILSPKRAMLVPLSTINVERVQATLWQLPESNIPLMSMGFFDGYKKHLSRKLAVRTGAVNGVRNRPAESSLDLTQIAGKARGVFLLTVADASDPKRVRSDEPRDPNDYDYGYDDDAPQLVEKLVVISDIGITARVQPDGVTVWANSIATTDALRNARVRVFTANNVLLAEGRTDNDGLWHHTRKDVWESRERPAIILVSTPAATAPAKPGQPAAEESAADMAYLKLENDLNADSAFETGGRPFLRQGYEAFAFTPRGVFRPGETVDFKVLVRDSRMKAPEPFPVAWKVQSSTGRTVGQGTALLSAEGGASFALPLVPSAPTGKYSMSVSLPGQGQSIGSCSFSVEDFAPPRIEVRLSAETPLVMAGDDLTVNIDAKYLFGTPVADGPWEATLKLLPYFFQPEGWSAFTFPTTLSSGDRSSFEESGKLDEKGFASFSFSPDSGWAANAVNLAFTVRVREDGGRWVARNLFVPYFKYPVMLGYELPKQEPQAGSPYSMRIAAVTPQGKAADVKSVKVKASLREVYYVRSDRGYSQSVKYTPVTEVDVPLNAGTGVFTFTPKQRGEYQVTINETASKSAIAANISVWSGLAGTDDGGSPLVDRVMLSWDKPRYAVGDTAQLKVRAPFSGKLLLVLEGEKELYRQVLTLKGAETTVRVPILQGMSPSAYCSAWVIRPVKPGEVWGAHRAFGVIPLAIDHSASKLAVGIDAPQKALPKGEMPVSLTLKNASGQPVRGEVALMLVDEGLLSLTNHATPNPFAFFTAKRALQSSAYDLYDNLMPLSTRKPLSLQAGGGEGADGSLLSPLSRRLELLSIFLGSVTTDAEGKAATTLKLPEYSGKGRIMAVAVSASGMGSADTQVRIAREITVEATVPRMVAPGDTFTAPVFVFASDDKPRKATITVETQGPLGIAGQKQFQVSLDAKKPKASLPLSFKAEDAADMSVIRIITAIDGSTDAPFEQRLEVPVRPPFPRLTRTGSGVVRAGQSQTIDVGAGFFKGTQRVALSFSDAPSVGLIKALEFLDSYPYGCLEQTTSRAWPYLAVPVMLKALDPEKAQDSEYRQALDFAVRRILSMQRPDGGFNMWPGSSYRNAFPWGSAYATHFLTEAKGSGLVPADALKASLAWLRSYLASPLPERGDYAIRDALSTKAYIAYVLTLNNDAPLGWMQFLKDQGSLLSPSARIFLAGSYAVATGKSAPLKELGTQPLRADGGLGWSLESDPRNEALRLLMWASVDPFAAETAALAARVIEDGGKNRWHSTQENGMAVLALGRYSEKTATKGKNYEAALSSGDKQIATFTHGQTPVFRRGDLPPAPPASPTPVTVAVNGEGAAYYAWTTSGVPTTAPAPASDGLFVGRRWIMPDGKTVDFMDFDKDGNPKTAARSLKVPQGTKVTVVLYLKPGASFNSLVLTDIVPGGFEIDNPNLVPDSDELKGPSVPVDPKTGKPVAAPKVFASATSLNTYMETRTEMRDDRLLLFVNEMPGRPSTFTYTLRAVTKGSFVLPPLAAEAMYDPTIKAVTAPGTVTVE